MRSLDTMIRLARFNIITACDGDGMVFMVCWWSVPPSISICHLGSSVENAHHSLQKKKTPTSQELPAAPAHHRLASSSERRPCQSPRRRGAQLARCLGFSPPSLQGSPNPSNRSGPVWTGIKPIQIQNLNSKKWKIPKNTSRCDKSNGVKFSQKFVHLVYFAGIWS